MRPQFRLLTGGCVLFAGFIAWLIWTLLHRVPPSDPLALVEGAQNLAKCIPAGRFPCQGVTPFPLFQQAPAVIMDWLGLGTDSSLRVFEILTEIAVLLAVAVPTVVITARRGVGVGALLALLLIPTPLLYYAGTSWGEPIAVLLNMSVVLCFVFRVPAWALFLSAVGAAIAKEVAFPVIIAVGGACALAVHGTDRRKLWSSVGVLAAGAAVGQGLDSLLNLARYGVLTNTNYLADPAVPWGLKPQLAAGVWLAPGGGVLPYWPTYLIAIAILVVGAWRGWRIGTWWGAAPPGLLLAALAINTGVLADWWAPFGWVAWGPRLMIPWLPAIALAAILVAPGASAACARALFSRPLAALAVASVAVYGVVLNVAARTTGAWTPFFNTPTAACPNPALATAANPPYYFTCLTHGMWQRQGSPIALVLAQARTSVAEPWIVVVSATVLGFVVLAYAHVAGLELRSVKRHVLRLTGRDSTAAP